MCLGGIGCNYDANQAWLASLLHTMRTNARLTSNSDDALLHRMSRSCLLWLQDNCCSVDAVCISHSFCFARSSFNTTEWLSIAFVDFGHFSGRLEQHLTLRSLY